MNSKNLKTLEADQQEWVIGYRKLLRTPMRIEFNTQTEHFKETKYGFEWGAASVERCFSDKKKGWVTLVLRTKKNPNGIQIYVTKTGKVRIHGDDGKEWIKGKE